MFGKRKSGAGAISEFWRWWAQARDRVDAAIVAGDAGTTAGEISKRVQAIDGGLEWELTPGRDSRHGLVVSPVGSATLRRLVAQWLAAAPPADATWEYHGARQPDLSVLTARLDIDGHEVDLAQLLFTAEVDADHAHVAVEVYHPSFATMSEQTRTRIAFMSLDWVLGEDRVETWVGPIDAVTDLPANAHPAGRLVATVDELADRHREPQWVIMSGERQGKPMMATAQRPLRSIRWPLFDTYVGVTLPYQDRGNGFPTDESLVQIRAAEDYVADVIGSHGELVAHETCGGVRTLHFYVDGSTDAATRIATGIRTFGGSASASSDVDLQRVRHLA